MRHDPDTEELYAQREQRFNDIVALRKPDKIPVMPLMMHYFPNKVAGVSNAAVQADHFLLTKLMKEATLKFGWEWAAAVGMPPAQVARGAAARSRCAGRAATCPTTPPFQWVEGEYVKADEVDQFLADPQRVRPAHGPAAHRRRLRPARLPPAPAAVLAGEHLLHSCCAPCWARRG